MHINKKFLKILLLIINIFIFFIISDLDYSNNIYLISMNTRTYILDGIYYLIFIFSLINIRYLIKTFKDNYMLLFILLICVVSYYWSNDRSNTKHALVMLFGSTLFALYLSRFFRVRELLNDLIVFIFIMEVINMIFIIFLPQYSTFVDTRIVQHNFIVINSYKGIFSHKNSLGSFVGFSFIFTLILRRFFKGFFRTICYLSLGMSFVLIVLSGSSTAVSVTALVSGIYLIILFRKRFNFALFLSMILLFFVIYFTQYNMVNELMIRYLHRDASFTGRTDIWNYVIGAIRYKPYLGYGFYGFWLSSASDNIMAAYQGQIQSSHEGFLDLTVQIGIFGLAAYLIYIFKFLISKSKMIFNKKNYIFVFPVLFLVFMILYNLSECYTVIPNSFYWIMQVVVITVFSNAENVYNEMEACYGKGKA